MVSVVPAGLTRLFQHPTLDWNLFSTNQHALTDREVGTGGYAGMVAARFLSAPASNRRRMSQPHQHH